MLIDFLKNITIRKYYLLKLWWDQKDSFLTHTGWVNSFRNKNCTDAKGEPVPWLTHTINKILEDRLRSDMKVFEYGSGYSTLFYAPRVALVHTVEYDKAWQEWLMKKAPANVHIFYAPQESEDYVKHLGDLPHEFDLIVIDGRRRNGCAEQALQKLSRTGVIIYDDTHREKYRKGYAAIEESGFKKLDFWGFANGSIDYKCTTLFYRDENCLGI